MAELATLWIVRHGESTANVAASAAEAAGAELIDLSHRDADVPLSTTGQEQARATGRWLAGLPEARRPDVAVVSPYLRAVCRPPSWPWPAPASRSAATSGCATANWASSTG